MLQSVSASNSRPFFGKRHWANGFECWAGNGHRLAHFCSMTRAVVVGWQQSGRLCLKVWCEWRGWMPSNVNEMDRSCRKPRGRPVAEHIMRPNATKSAIRLRAEHVIIHWMNRHSLIIHIVGLARALAKLTLTSFGYISDRLISHKRCGVTI
jgi:hypothetical protein